MDSCGILILRPFLIILSVTLERKRRVSASTEILRLRLRMTLMIQRLSKQRRVIHAITDARTGARSEFGCQMDHSRKPYVRPVHAREFSSDRVPSNIPAG